MQDYTIEEKEIFSLLTPKQISEISDLAVVKRYAADDIIYNQNEPAGRLFILLDGEVVLTLPSLGVSTSKPFVLQIDIVRGHGIFGAGLLFGIERYSTKAKATKSSNLMIFDAMRFLEIIRENKSEFPIMAYIARVYFLRYINAMKQFEQGYCQLSGVETNLGSPS
jgi:CRP-like cAMP-binding protein